MYFYIQYIFNYYSQPLCTQQQTYQLQISISNMIRNIFGVLIKTSNQRTQNIGQKWFVLLATYICNIGIVLYIICTIFHDACCNIYLIFYENLFYMYIFRNLSAHKLILDHSVHLLLLKVTYKSNILCIIQNYIIEEKQLYYFNKQTDWPTKKYWFSGRTNTEIPIPILQVNVEFIYSFVDRSYSTPFIYVYNVQNKIQQRKKLLDQTYIQSNSEV
eukprot:TRINITY_DN8996_c0_g1_i4.p2 TRINITY_DN8996_c0_g1~~TRINITY_DN8996_c0_g1_i4.p2  ORF type:complete len:216 (-),score=-21.54 TRINITY_DN8996_c0_g1_i4:849-1496(-)